MDGLLDVIADIEKEEGGVRPVVVATTARDSRANIGFQEMSALSEEKPCLIIFGTGWGDLPRIYLECLTEYLNL